MRRRATIDALQVVELLAALRILGLDSTALCRAVRLDPAMVADPAAPVPVSKAVQLFAEAERRSGDPLVGIHAGEHLEGRGILTYLLMSSAKIDDGLRQLERFSHLELHTLRVRVTRDAHTTSIIFTAGEEYEKSAHAVDYLLMAGVRILRRALGNEFRPDEIHVRHAGWRDRAEAARAFGCRVHYNQPDNRIVFPARTRRMASRVANPVLAEQLEKFATAMVSRATPPATSREAVVDVVRVLLAGGVRADRATVARQLHVSQRTLQRRLEEDGTTFKALRDDVLWELVEALLSNASPKLEAVALDVGFSDVAAFSRAFKRRTGYSPTQYRERLIARAIRQRRAVATRPGDPHPHT